MAGGKERVLRRRIRSVQTTKKITKAMELIASSRIVKAQQRVEAALPYTRELIRAISAAASHTGGGHPLTQTEQRLRERAAVLIITSDRGLAGAYSSATIKEGEQLTSLLRADGKQTALITVGRKIENYFRFRKFDIADSFIGFLDEPTYEDARAIAAAIVPKFEDGTYDRVDIVYTQFLSAGTQQVVTRQFLPLDTSTITDNASDGPTADYEFEPSPELILDRLLPRYAEARLFAALLEGAASFFAAQQRAMKSATDNAEELITKLSRAMNRARQDAITTEIMEIVGGAEALRQGKSSEMDLIPDNALSTRDLLVDVVDYNR